MTVDQCVLNHSRTTGTTRFLLYRLAQLSVKKGYAWSSRATLARELGITERSVKRSIRQAVRLEELVVERGGGRGHLSHYRVRCAAPFLHAEKGTQTTPIEAAERGTSATERGTLLVRKGDVRDHRSRGSREGEENRARISIPSPINPEDIPHGNRLTKVDGKWVTA